MREAIGLAIETLSWMELEGLSERTAFSRASRQLQVTGSGQLRIAQLLVLETVRRLNFVDRLIECAVDGQLDIPSLEHGVRSFLRLLCYWAKFRGASDHEIVRMVRAARSVLGWKALHPIEYALGRILASDLAETTDGLSADDTVALNLFHPPWFMSACMTLIGRPAALKLVEGNLKRPPSYIRLNTLRGSEEAFLRETEKAGIDLKPVEGLPLAFKVLSSKRPIVRTELYKRGRIAIQDKGSILVSAVAAPEAGDLVLDLCAAPGAKTTHLAELMQNKGTIYSIDRSPARMSFWKQEVSRLGVEIAHPLIADATKPLPMDTEADVVVLDPPCSNSGTFWKSPVAKWTVSPERVRTLAIIQGTMLENAAPLVRKGGALVYSTCTILAEESERIVGRFLRMNPDFEAIDSVPRIGLPGLYGLEKGQRLYPYSHDCNGHFLLKMRRTG